MTLSHVKSYGRFLIFSSIWINEGDAEYDLMGAIAPSCFTSLHSIKIKFDIDFKQIN